jgi:putative (di)nucleoside polyphosphate hydrolase
MKADPATLPYRPCVGLMVINRDGLVWVGRRIGSPPQKALAAANGRIGGWWQMPQGGIDDGEDAARAAMRELAEETGMRTAQILAESALWYHYDLPPNLVGRAWGGRYRGQRQKWFLMRFTGEDSEIDIFPRDHDPEFDRWRWAAVDELDELIVPFKRDVYAQVVAEFRDKVGPMASRGA